MLAALLVLPTMAVVRLGPEGLAKGLAVWTMAASLFAFFAYLGDKRRAQRSEWRTPESVLHFLELIGGWPGAFLARQWLRHKSSKMSFRIWSWLIISLYQVISADALRGWPTAHAVRGWLQQL